MRRFEEFSRIILKHKPAVHFGIVTARDQIYPLWTCEVMLVSIRVLLSAVQFLLDVTVSGDSSITGFDSQLPDAAPPHSVLSATKKLLAVAWPPGWHPGGVYQVNIAGEGENSKTERVRRTTVLVKELRFRSSVAQTPHQYF